MLVVLLVEAAHAFTCGNYSTQSYVSNQISISLTAKSEYCLIFSKSGIAASFNQLGSATAGLYQAPYYSSASYGSYSLVKVLDVTTPARFVHFGEYYYGLIRLYSATSTVVRITYYATEYKCSMLTVSNRRYANFTLPHNSSETLIVGTDYCFLYSGYGNAAASFRFNPINYFDTAKYYKDATAYTISSGSSTYSMSYYYPCMIDIYVSYANNANIFSANFSSSSAMVGSVIEGSLYSMTSTDLLSVYGSIIDGGSSYVDTINTLSVGAIIGLGVGGFVLFFIILVVIAIVVTKVCNKKKQEVVSNSSSSSGKGVEPPYVPGSVYTPNPNYPAPPQPVYVQPMMPVAPPMYPAPPQQVYIQTQQSNPYQIPSAVPPTYSKVSGQVNPYQDMQPYANADPNFETKKDLM